MSRVVKETGALNRLKELIAAGKKVIIFNYNDQGLLYSLRDGLSQKKYANVEIWQCFEEMSDYISRDEIDNILEMYHMYDFSDKVLVISDPDQFGSVFNYVKNGILSKEEMVKAVLA